MRPNLILLGAPGSGKGTQANRLVSEFGYKHLSTGDLLRAEIAKESDLGQRVKGVLDRGDLVDDNMVLELLKVNCDLENASHIFDGFPRTTDQAKALDEFLGKKQMPITATIALEADDDRLVERLLQRGQTSGRTDDQDEEKIRNRFQEYNLKTAPLRSYYEAQNKFHSIDGIGTIEEITDRLTAVIDHFL